MTAPTENTAYLIAEVEFLADTDHPENIARRLGLTLDALELALRRARRDDLAVRYRAARDAKRKRTA